MFDQNVLGFLSAPDREDSLKAVSLAILRIRSRGMTFKEIAKALDCSVDCLANAVAEKNLLSFDAVARLGHFWPEDFAVIAQLWGRGTEAPSLHERVARVQHELNAIQRALP